MSARITSDTGVDRLEPTHDGKNHNEVKKKIQFLMSEEREKAKQTLFSVQTGMTLATNAIFTQMQAMTSFNLFGDKVLAAMFKELKQLEHGSMLGARVLRAIDPDTMSSEDKKKR